MNTENNKQYSSISVPIKTCQCIRKYLEECGVFDSSRRIQKEENNLISIPVKNVDSTFVEKLSEKISEEVNINTTRLPPSKKALVKIPFEDMCHNVKMFLSKHEYELTEELTKDLPTHWERHGDLVMVSDTCFLSETWRSLPRELWTVVAKSLQCVRLARKKIISTNGYRSPQVQLLLGDDGWVQHIDNHIIYTYDVTKCMFSAGNITEKLRIANQNCSSEVVVDLYAGIGYFTLPFLVHAKAKHVHACEWNPDSVQALKKNLCLNGVSDKCSVYQGDNRKVCPVGVADRVNLGLIPSSQEGWSVACAALKQSGGILHVHSNVTSKQSTDSDNVSEIESACEVKQLKTNTLEPYTSKFGTYSLCSEHTGELGDQTDEDRYLSKHREYCHIAKRDTSSSTHKQSDLSEITQTYDQFVPNIQFGHKQKEEIWKEWAEYLRLSLKELCQDLHKIDWTADVLHIEHVKSYAPHIDHIVVDVHCFPSRH